MSESIQIMQKKNRETMKQINKDADLEINEMQMKNQTNLNQVTDMKLRSQADLQITKNKLQDVAVEIENQDRIIKEKKNQIDKQKMAIQQLNTELK